MTKPTAKEVAAKINSTMGDNTVVLGSDQSLAVNLWPTGVFPFDMILGGGLPAGRSLEIYGGYSVLKSYLALRAIGSVQAAGGTCALVDSEHAYDPEWAASLGVDVDELIVQHPSTGEDAVMLTQTLIQNEFDLVVWDSVAAAIPKAYAEARPGDSAEAQPARLATLMSKGLSRMNSVNKKTCLLFINQTRTNLGITWGSKETTPGGNALPFYASLRINLRRAGRITRDVRVNDTEKEIPAKETVGYKIKATLEKSKLNKPHREVWFRFNLDGGEVDEENFLLSQGQSVGLVTSPSKGWYTIPEVFEDGEKMRMSKLTEFIRNDEEVREWLKMELMTQMME